jgi:hypothetical protein
MWWLLTGVGAAVGWVALDPASPVEGVGAMLSTSSEHRPGSVLSNKMTETSSNPCKGPFHRWPGVTKGAGTATAIPTKFHQHKMA